MIGGVFHESSISFLTDSLTSVLKHDYDDKTILIEKKKHFLVTVR